MSVSTRTRYLIATRGTAIAAVLALVGVAALAGAAYTYTNPGVEEVTEQTAQQRIAVSGGTSAVVTGNTTLYDRGRRLQNQPVYFFRATPNLTIRVRSSVPDGRQVSVDQRIALVHTGTRDGMEFWRSTRVLETTTTETTDGGVVTRATVNMSAVRENLADKRQEIGTAGSVRTVVRANVSYETDRYDGRVNATVPVIMLNRAYWLDGEIAASRTHITPVERTVTRDPDPVQYGGLGALGLLSLAGAAGVAVVSRRGIDIRAVEIELSRARYDEWISRGDFPTKMEKTYIRVDTLEDLVDIAIDSGKRVIHDDEYDAYAVVDGDLIYYFTTQEGRIEAWLNMNP
ncbi:hypothetical protein BRC83_03300 [Halobacteriales archaeon QS_1_68_17]|nr:MAG: hypothetical protein BRC83_03300 [Halobacteriales archaeon QS_1_68_17]